MSAVLCLAGCCWGIQLSFLSHWQQLLPFWHQPVFGKGADNTEQLQTFKLGQKMSWEESVDISFKIRCHISEDGAVCILKKHIRHENFGLRKFSSFPVGDYRVWRKDRKLGARSSWVSGHRTGLGDTRAAPCISSIPGDGARLRFGLLSEDNPGCVMKRRLWIGCIFLFFYRSVCTEGKITIFCNNMLNITCLFSQDIKMQIFFTFISFCLWQWTKT